MEFSWMSMNNFDVWCGFKSFFLFFHTRLLISQFFDLICKNMNIHVLFSVDIVCSRWNILMTTINKQIHWYLSLELLKEFFFSFDRYDYAVIFTLRFVFLLFCLLIYSNTLSDFHWFERRVNVFPINWIDMNHTYSVWIF